MKCTRSDPKGIEAVWRMDNTCSYCGSLHPDDFMKAVRRGDCFLGATDKGYKVYATIGSRRYKFYFMHLSEPQMKEFIDLYNRGSLQFEGGQPFYVLPYFCKAEEV